MSGKKIVAGPPVTNAGPPVTNAGPPVTNTVTEPSEATYHSK